MSLELSIDDKLIESHRIMKRLGWRAGLQLFGKSNTGAWVIARHWPHLVAWSWTLWISWQKPRGTGWSRHFFLWARYRPQHRPQQVHLSLRLFWLIDIYYQRQDYDWMIQDAFKNLRTERT